MTAFEPSKIVSLILRIVTFVLLLLSLIVLATANVSFALQGGDSAKYNFTDIKACRYMISAIIIGIVYTLMQIALLILNFKAKEVGLILLDFYGDKIITFLLATGVGAGFGVSIDLKENLDPNGVLLSSFFAKIDASASLLLFASICVAVLSVFSSYALVPRSV